MAEETQKPGSAPEPPATAEVVVEKPAAPEPAPEKPAEPAGEVAVEAVKEESKTKEETKEVKISRSLSFKEETNVVSELPEPQKKALEELKQLIQEALKKHEFTEPPPPPPPPPPAKEEEKAADVKVEEEKTDEKAASDVPSTSAESKPVETETTGEEKKDEQEEAKDAAVVTEEVPAKTTTADDGAKTVEPAKEADTAPAGESKTEETKTEESKTGEAKTEEAKTEEAKIEESKTGEAKTGEAKTEESKTEEAKTEDPKTEETPAPPPLPEEVFIWGIPILGDERSDVILLKFLRARDFKVKEAFTMIKNTVRWRKEFGIDGLLEEDLGNELEKAVFMHGFDKQGHPVCYNVYGAFQDKQLYQNCFADEEKRVKFLRWRIQLLEKSIRKLDFSPNGICTIVQVNDLKNSPGPAKRELRQATNQALAILQDNYPEFVAKQVFINVPWWYLAFNRMISPFLTQRTKSKFVFAGPTKSVDTLYKYIAVEQVPVQYGGLSREGDQEFSVSDPATEFTIKPSTKHTVEFSFSERCMLVWEHRVVGWDVSYGAEFAPSAEDGYTVIVSKTRKVSSSDEPIIHDTFKISEPGKVVLTIDNQTSKKKKLLYRSKTKPLPQC